MCYIVCYIFTQNRLYFEVKNYAFSAYYCINNLPLYYIRLIVCLSFSLLTVLRTPIFMVSYTLLHTELLCFAMLINNCE